MSRLLFILLSLMFVVTTFGHVVAAGGLTQAMTRQERLNQLKSQEAQLKLENAEAVMQRQKIQLDVAKKLYDQKIYTQNELKLAEQEYERTRLAHEQAKIELQRTRLEFLQNASLITVTDAMKYRDDAGHYRVRVELRNDSDLSKARSAMANVKNVKAKELSALLAIDQVIVSLQGDVQISSGEGDTTRSLKAIVGEPFQRVIPKLSHGQKQSLEFKLLQKGIEALTVHLKYLNREVKIPVFLKKGGSQDLPTLSSGQYSLEGQLGSKVLFHLDLEWLGREDRSFPLRVLNLPRQIPFAFLDPQSGARVTQATFTSEISKRSIQLVLSVPEKLDAQLIDQSLEFRILVTQTSALKGIDVMRQKFGETIPVEHLKKIKSNQVQLQFIPKGVGKLEIVVSNLFKEIKQGEELGFKFNLLNAGTLELTKVEPELDLPLDWEAKIDPPVVDLIEPGRKSMISIKVEPPSEVTVGEYSIKINSKGHSGFEIVDSLSKNFTVRIESESHLTGTLVLVVILVTMVLVIAVATVRIARR